MLAYIKGKLISSSIGQAIVENNGMGYEIIISNTTLSKVSTQNGEIKLFTYFNVREDGFYIYGFANQEEKVMFLKLISISGIGAKVAMAILSGIELGALAACILSSDYKTLSSIKGVGKKTAERIVLELREKVSTEECSYINDDLIKNSFGHMTKDIEDAILALRTLGLSQMDATKAVSIASKQATKIEDIISLALRSLNS